MTPTACRSSGMRATPAAIHACGSRGEHAARDDDASGIGRAHAEQHVGQRLLAVARHAGDRGDFAGAQRERHARRARRRTVTTVDVAHDVTGRVRLRDRRAARRGPTISCASDARSAAAAGKRRDQLAGAQHRDAVRHAQHLGQLVADEDQRQPFGDQLLRASRTAIRIPAA